MRELIRRITSSNGLEKLNSFVPGLPPAAWDVGHNRMNFRLIGLSCAGGIRLNGTAMFEPGYRICWLTFRQAPAGSKPAVHNAERSPDRNAAFGTVTPVTGRLPSAMTPW